MPVGPEIPDWADAHDLDRGVRGSLKGLDPRAAERVARHLVAAGTLLDEDPEQALAHARAARDRASRIAAVREAVGVAAYRAGDYAEAARELRAYRRLSGDHGYRSVLADCERALGRPEVALRLVAEALADGPDAEEIAELRLVEAGARQDLGEPAAARLVLEGALGGRPTPESLSAGNIPRLRLASAYADLLRAQGEDERADEWLAAIAAADPENAVGALERLGVEFTDDEEPDEDDGAEEEADEGAGTAGDAGADPAVSEGTGPDAPGLDGPDFDAPGLDGPDFDGPDFDGPDFDGPDFDGPNFDGPDFDAEVEAEVAELLGETGTGGEAGGGPGDGSDATGAGEPEH